MSRETITGKLKVYRQRKYRRTNNILGDYIIQVAEDALDKARYYPPMLVIHGERRTVDDRTFIYKFRGVPAALKEAEDHSTVTVVATLDEWQNGLGAWLNRPKVLSVVPQAEEAASAP